MIIQNTISPARLTHADTLARARTQQLALMELFEVTEQLNAKGETVLAAELFNTALEHLIDHLHPALHPSIKIAKDCAAGSVLLLSLSAVAVFIAFLMEQY